MKKITFLLISLTLTICYVGASNGKDNDLNQLAVANNDLGLKLYHLLVKEASGNVFFSPFSLSNAFGMLFVGAGGNSETQLRSALGYDKANLQSDEVPTAFNQYIEKVIPKNQTKDPDYVFNLANELLVAKGFKVKPQYKQQVKDLFHAYIKEVDFMTNSAQIVQDVNNFVKEQTHGKIDKLLSDIDPSTVLLILNAIYFKGNWKTQFDKKLTKPQEFYNDGSNSQAKEVPLMHITSKFPYASDGDLQALELPYKGDNISMIVLLPNQRNGLSSLEESITPEKIQDIQKKMYNTKVIVSLPKFKIEYKKQLNSDFKELGATDIFKRGVADFSGITQKNNIYVSDVIHKAAVEVNEEGSEAAAATAIGFRATAAIIRPPPTPIFTADHPFMFAIIDKRNNLILFLGRVTVL